MTTSPDAVCTRIAQRLAEKLGPQRFNMWFDRSTRLDYHDDGRQLQVAVPNDFVAEWIGKHFTHHIREAAADELGQQCQVHLRVDPRRFDGQSAPVGHAPQSRDTNAPTDGERQRHAFRTTRPARRPLPTSITRQAIRHRLGDFVVGRCNELAFRASHRLVDEDNPAMVSPLFVYGGCGLGKTHLLQGICHRMLNANPQARVLYTTGEQFTNDYIQAVRNNKLEAFRKSVRQLDLLAVDDVHFIASKEKTQQEFQHSFDAIELAGSRVVLASDSHPRQIRQFAETLVSRCMRGMVVEIRKPDADTRLRLVQALAARRGLNLMESVVAVLAERCDGSVRDIEGMLTRLHALSELSRDRSGTGMARSGDGDGEGATVIGHALVSRLFDADAPHAPRKVVRFETIVEVVGELMEVTRSQIVGNSRNRRIVMARSLAIYLARELTSMSYPEVAAAMDRTSHSTIVTAFRRLEKQLASAEADRTRVVLAQTGEELGLRQLVERLKDEVLRASTVH